MDTNIAVLSALVKYPSANLKFRLSCLLAAKIIDSPSAQADIFP